MKYLFSMMLMTAPVINAPFNPGQITSDMIMGHITSVGAKQTIADYFEKPEWSAIMKGISSGNDDWLKVYVVLNPVADAAAGEDLGQSIFDAVPVQPFKVLPILSNNGQYKIEDICSFTFEAEIPPGGINAYLTRLEHALSQAHSRKEQAIANSCRRGIQATRITFKGGPGY